MNVTVIGSGYVGLVTGACFSEFGVQVTCADKIRPKIEALQNCEIPIYEPGLEELVRRNMESGRLSFTTDTDEAIQQALAEDSRTVRLPLNRLNLLRKIARTSAQLGNATEGEPDDAEIAQALELSVTEVRDTVLSGRRAVSLDRAVFDEDEDTTLLKRPAASEAGIDKAGRKKHTEAVPEPQPVKKKSRKEK